MFGTMAGGVNPERSPPEKNWVRCLADDIRVFEALEGSTDSSSVMEMLTHRHYESMFSSTALVYRRSHMCRFECNVRMCAEELLP